MIGRLIEEEKIRFHDKKPCQMRPHDPAAAERASWTIKIRFAKGETSQDALRLRLKFPATVFVEEMQSIVVSGFIGSTAAFVFLNDALRLNQLGRNGECEFEHRFISGGRSLLRQEADTRVLLDTDFTFIR